MEDRLCVSGKEKAEGGEAEEKPSESAIRDSGGSDCCGQAVD